MPLLCSIADVRGRFTTPIEDDPLGALIEAASDTMEEYVGWWLAPRPADPSATTTLLFDVETRGTSLRLSSGGRRIGIRSITALGVATTGQPETGGVYTSVPLASVLLRPRPGPDGPASSIVLSTGAFSRGFSTVTATGSFGPATVAPRVRETALQLVMLGLNYNPGLSSQTIGSWSESRQMGYIAERDQLLATLPGAIAF